MASTVMNSEIDTFKENYKIGDRVELHPATDLWMRGERYGEITGIGTKYARIKLDKSEKTVSITPRNVYSKV
jgi:hypothetical protein